MYTQEVLKLGQMSLGRPEVEVGFVQAHALAFDACLVLCADMHNAVHNMRLVLLTAEADCLQLCFNVVC